METTDGAEFNGAMENDRCNRTRRDGLEIIKADWLKERAIDKFNTQLSAIDEAINYLMRREQ